MKKFLEGLKDILYDSTDYVIMIAIVGIVVFVIGWRLDLLFAKDAKDIPPKNNVVAETDKDSNTKPSDPVSKDGKEDININPPKEEPTEDNSKEEPATGQTIKVNIPNGSLPSQIGNILESNGLVSSNADFIEKLLEMKLDTKLKSGNYEFKTNTPIEDVITLLTK